MYAVERLSSYISRGVYTVSGPFHPFGGAVDIIVVQQQDGSFKSSPWYVRFGKFQGVLKAKENIVKISVNGTEADFHMYLDHKGEAYFLAEVEGEEGDSVFSSASSGDENDENKKLLKIQSLNIDDEHASAVSHIDIGTGNVITRTRSKRSRIFGLVFGRNSRKEDGGYRYGESDVERASSLERAEIAADLLEMKWSTNLRTDRQKGNKRESKPSEEPDNRQPKLVGGVNEEDKNLIGQVQDHKDREVADMTEVLGSPVVPSPVVDDDLDHNIPGPVLSETVSPSCDVTDVVSMNLENNDVTTDVNPLPSGIDEPLLGVSVLEKCDFSVTGKTAVEKLEPKNNAVKVDNEKAYEEGNEGASSYIYFEATESSDQGIVGTDELFNRTHSPSPNMVEICTQILISEINKLPQSGIHLCEKSTDVLDNLETSISDPLEAEVVEIIQHTTVIEGHMTNKALETDQVENVENQPDLQLTGFSSTQFFTEDNRLVHVKSSTVTDHSEVDQVLDSINEPELNAISVLSPPRSTRDQVQKMDNLREGTGIHELQISTEGVGSHKSCVSNLSEETVDPHLLFLKNLDEEHLLSSNMDNVVNGSVHKNEVDIHLVEDIDGVEHDSSDKNQDSPFSSSHQSFESPLSHASASYPGEPIQESFSHESIAEDVRTPGSPINIPRKRSCTGEAGDSVGSLPHMWDLIHDVERADTRHAFSRSFDSSEKCKWNMLGKDFSGNLKLSASEGNLAGVLCRTKDVVGDGDDRDMKEEKLVPSDCLVEISLCRHLLFEGMGAEAASQAFDSEKLDLEKFTSLGPSIVKNDRLVVRINGCYFPWESAAPIILGMVSFGHGHIFEPKGAITVEQLERPHEGETVPSGGSWRIWPFNFGKSKSSASPPPNISNENVGENQSTSNDSITSKTKSTKKKVRSLVPMSEQLASLNLKEGRNVVTFTFSTAMLGRQQVDARIYLWKWNTQIVVSDVDGTITKSDVLGQFMPLVGKDWSHIGVAHLFSAIKENGYQLLFLSARAISQAYLTRQFLFNLKQDGKALPDGPVVISPDGLFPSLYREVIRRAPHEFKIACLEDIRALFPSDCNPFYAGFGNRDTDEVSYLKGEVAVNRWVDTKSYTSLHSLVHSMFPAIHCSEQEEYNTWNYWKMRLPDISF
ncbi:phosphatidate phosphatase PAH2-like isoform X2 [Aristolochia californica]|uniref:phosphatidate phosphatase PAH2-like isoform X2 n=1 Tax=Aristolochia californica TaxID=171875 RepID=UPI0035DC7179